MNDTIKVHKLIMLSFIITLSLGSLSAQTEDDEEQEARKPTKAELVANELQEHISIMLVFLGSPWVKGIAFIALVSECIMLFTKGREEPGLFKKFLPWIIGTSLFLAASVIVDLIMKMNGLNFTKVFEK